MALMQRAKQVLSVVAKPAVFVGRRYDAVAQRYPFGTGVVTTVAKTSAADLFAQKVLEKREEVDWKRHGVFFTFGLFYLGGFQYYLYNHLFVKWCAGMTAVLGHRGAAPIKTFIDQAIHHPISYFPVFYGMKGYVEGWSATGTYARYRAELWDNCKALWTIWVPAQLVNFSVVPLHLRIPFVAGVSFAWTIVISAMRGALDTTTAAASTTAQLEDAATQVAAVAVADPAAADEHPVPMMSVQGLQGRTASVTAGLKAFATHAHADALNRLVQAEPDLILLCSEQV